MSAALSFAELADLTRGRVGTIDAPCPICGPGRHTTRNKNRKVLRLWASDGTWIGYRCVRCDASGWAADNDNREIDRAKIARMQAEAKAHAEKSRDERRAIARRLWNRSSALAGTIGERYLREARGIPGALPSTLRFLPGRLGYPPALIAAFALPEEEEPGILRAPRASQVQAVQLVKLKPDGSGKANVDPKKVSIGPAKGMPIVLAPPNDILGLAICEGIEDGLSAHAMTGLGVWAAAGASFLPAVAEAVPTWINCVTIFADGDPAGQKGASGLTAALRARGLHVEEVRLGS